MAIGSQAVEDEEASVQGTLTADQTSAISAALPDAQQIQPWIDRYSVLADRTRLTILLAVRAAGQICMSDLTAATRFRGPTISQALRLLRAHGMVARHRHGRRVHYQLADSRVRHLLDGMMVTATPQLAEYDNEQQ